MNRRFIQTSEAADDFAIVVMVHILLKRKMIGVIATVYSVE